ncbi:MAG: hypothetical protein K6F87_03220 [Lachnospiraceae bacterium]|nr:hypothetical protein [Lachnospiraceae bacterium]
MPATDVYAQIYEMLDKVSPVPYDCGTLCGSVCCKDAPSKEELYIYLLPGEKEYLESVGCPLKIERQNSGEHYLPASWGEYVYLASCNGPKECPRKCRPIQCRTFPLEPHLAKKGVLQLIYCDVSLPYKCPLITESVKLSDDFIKTTYKAWEILMKDRIIWDMVKMDSRNRTNCQIII